MKKPVIILGAGGHSRSLLDVLKLMRYEIIGLTEKNSQFHGQVIMGIPVIGDDQIVFKYKRESVLLVNAIGMIGQGFQRRIAFEYFKKNGYSFSSVIHPLSVISSFAELTEGVQVMAGAVIQPQSNIGMNTIVNTGSRIDHECRIGEHVHIAPGVTISGCVSIANGVFIGAGATIIQGVQVGENSIVGAGALILKDVPAGNTAVGVPAHYLKFEETNK